MLMGIAVHLILHPVEIFGAWYLLQVSMGTEAYPLKYLVTSEYFVIKEIWTTYQTFILASQLTQEQSFKCNCVKYTCEI